MVGVRGECLDGAEARLFSERAPFGFILFRRNCRSPGQVRALTDALHAIEGCAEAPILIDQEGGRVARLGPPGWAARCAPRRIGELAERDLEAGRRAAFLHARLIAADLAPLGITVTCAPLLDLGLPGQTEAIGDRAYAPDPLLVGELGAAAIEGFLAGGVLPVIKHLPGHGRATVDSHLKLPVVDADGSTLEADLQPFVRNRAAPLGMTAHIVFRAFDGGQPATCSACVIGQVIRERIGFKGLLFSDDLSMEALTGTIAERASGARAAGCDIALHCNGEINEAREVLGAAGPLDDAGVERWRRARAELRAPIPFDTQEGTAELDALLARVAPAVIV